MDKQKRKRVAFSNSDGGAEERKGDEPSSKRARNEEDDEEIDEAAAGFAAREARKQKLLQKFESYEDDENAQNEVEEVDASAYDDIQADDNDEGDEEEFAGDNDKFDAKQRKKAAGDDDTDGASRVKVLKRVQGEHSGPLEAELNEAGEAFEPFNLRQERDEGYFDTSGNYVWKKKTADDFDAWLGGIDEMDPSDRVRMQHIAAKSGGFAAGTGVAEDADGENAEDEDEIKSEDEGAEAPEAYKATLLTTLIELLEDGESIPSALKRYSGKGKLGMAAKNMASFNKLTETADALVRHGMPEVYTTAYKELLWEAQDACADADIPFRVGEKQVDKPSAAAASQQANSTSVANAIGSAAVASWQPVTNTKWVYKWSLEDGAQEFGPFSSAKMAAWKAAQFFSAAPAFVKEKINESVAAAPNGGDEDSDDDIFSGAGKYKAPAATATEWKPVSEVQF